MKMNEVKPAAFIQGLNRVGQYSYDDMLNGLSWLACNPDDVMSSMSGLGRLGQSNDGLMKAIMKNAAEMNMKVVALDKARALIAEKNPAMAAKMFEQSRRDELPGANEARGVVMAMNDAAKMAAKATTEANSAKRILAQGDSRAAAAVAVQAVDTARQAATLANRAEKTRLTRALDTVAATLEAQANYVDGVSRTEMARSGPNPRTNALMASAQQLRQNAKQLRAQSAVVATVDPAPPQAPSPQRVAEVANRFNIRTANRKYSRATISVLSDLADSALAQVPDYSGAVSYYGNDDMGRFAADVEFGRVGAALAGLGHMVGRVGAIETLPVFSAAEATLSAGIKAAQMGYRDAVIPAWTGGGKLQKVLQTASMQVMGLSGLGKLAALGKAEWDAWCDRRASGEVKDPGWGPYAAKGGVEACKKDGLLYSEPWSCKGYLEREAITWGDFAICVGKGAGQWILSGQASKDVGAVTSTVNTVTQVTQGTPPANAAPPAATRPPVAGGAFGPGVIKNTSGTPFATTSSIVPQAFQQYVPPQVMQTVNSVPKYVWYAGGAALGIGGLLAFALLRRPSR